jgi:hypothetical protein
MPTGGGFKSNTEYEVAASNMAEAAHCILGSLAKLDSDTPFFIEKGHIEEEMGIIQGAMREYTKEIYLTRVFQGKYAMDTIKSVKKAAPVLKKKAINAKSRLSKDLPKEIRELANAAYDFLITLAEKMLWSVSKLIIWNPKSKRHGELKMEAVRNLFNAYKDKELQETVRMLQRKVNGFLKLSDEGTLGEPYLKSKKPKLIKKKSDTPELDDLLAQIRAER